MTSAVPDLPAGWRVVRARGPAGFTTHAVLARPDGTEVEWTSRRHRKGLGLRPSGARTPGGRASALSWWIGALFGVGSICFALGSVPAYVDAVDPAAVAATFFVGSIFFTSAGYLQFHEVLRAPGGVLAESARPRRLAALVGWKPRRIDFWAVLVQLVGTVFFNISTFAATQTDLTTEQAKRLVWAPDVYGSICFLVASWLAYSEVNRGILPRSDRSVGWRIAALNLAGSVAFGVAAVAARYLRSTGQLANLALVNLGTFLGAVCFLLGAVLLPVESARDRS
ncbi:hypothetical protein [Cellulomonas sp. ICMP 17802]|uniref:hypothetical protein n=1 Tax=Cellulomonas sp. ICMP 17802 TaxID=3239199 RepID=UPI00351AB415